MRRDLQKHPPAAYWPICGVITVLVAAFLGLGDVQVPMRPGSLHVISVASANPLGQDPVSLAPTPEGNPVTGNPLWTIPIGALSETSARPVFSPSRRPPTPSVFTPPDVPPAKPLPPPKGPDRPRLTLLGTIIGESNAIAIFLDETSHGAIRLQTGQSHGGWILRSVRGRVARFERDHQEAIVTLAPLSPGRAWPDRRTSCRELLEICAACPCYRYADDRKLPQETMA
jgi:hypothetical protein